MRAIIVVMTSTCEGEVLVTSFDKEAGDMMDALQKALKGHVMLPSWYYDWLEDDVEEVILLARQGSREQHGDVVRDDEGGDYLPLYTEEGWSVSLLTELPD